MTDKIKEAAEKYAFRVPYDGSNNFYNEDRYKGFVDGATSEAAREYWDAARFNTKITTNEKGNR